MDRFPTFQRGLFASSTLEPDQAEFIVFGVPFNRRSTARGSIFMGPDAIRNASVDLETLSTRFGVDYDKIRICDLGDIIGMNFEDIFIKTVETIRGITKLGKKPVFLGGEHTVTWAAVREINPSHLLIFDAHLDLRDTFLGERVSSATFLRRMAEEMPELQIIHMGFRGASRDELEYARKRKLEIISSQDIHEKTGNIEEILVQLSEARSVYVSVDLDVLDPAYMREVANPEPEGLSPTVLFDSFRILTSVKVYGFDVVELSPTGFWDPSHHLAAKTVFELMSASSRDPDILFNKDILP